MSELKKLHFLLLLQFFENDGKSGRNLFNLFNVKIHNLVRLNRNCKSQKLSQVTIYRVIFSSLLSKTRTSLGDVKSLRKFYVLK